MLLAVFVLFGVRSGIAPQPELFHELVPLFVGLQGLESLPLFIANDVADVFGEPFLVGRLQFLLEPLLLLTALLFRHRLGDGFVLLFIGGWTRVLSRSWNRQAANRAKNSQPKRKAHN